MQRRSRYVVLLASAVLCLALLLRHHARLENGAVAGLTMLAAVAFAARMLLAASSRPYLTNKTWARALARRRVVIVVPVYNEDPSLFRLCLASVARQTRAPDAVWVVDDCSSTPDCLHIAHAFARQPWPFEVHVVRAPQNAGKRHAQAHAFVNDEADVWVTCDSDTILAADALEEGLKPFSDRRVYAVAGLTLGHNWKRNALTRILDIEFANSFLIGRASMSKFGSVLVACGTLAFYRDRVIQEHLDDYLNETFLGHPVRAGDDRRLTQYALLHGRVVFQGTAVAYTALPERIGHLVRQRLRWSASFYRGAVWVGRNISMRRVAYWLITAQVVELVLVVLMLAALAMHSAAAGTRVVAAYLTYTTALSYLRSIRYLALSRRDMTLFDRVSSVALAPLIGLLYTFVLNPVRYWSVTRVTDTRWGTRKHVEVALVPTTAAR